MIQNEILLVYKSSTGFTKKYAQMIAEETGCTILPFKEATVKMLSAYRIVLFGSRAYAGRIDGYGKMMKMFYKSKVEKLVLFVTGATPAAAAETIEELWRQNLTPKEREQIPHFYMPGGLCYEKMSLPDKGMMKIAAAIVKMKKNKTAQEEAFAQAIATSYDSSDKKYIKPLVRYLTDHRDNA